MCPPKLLEYVVARAHSLRLSDLAVGEGGNQREAGGCAAITDSIFLPGVSRAERSFKTVPPVDRADDVMRYFG